MTEMMDVSELPDDLDSERVPAASSRVACDRFERLEGRPLFQADWLDALFIHFEVDPTCLALQIPFPLDLFNGRAFVSLVAFTQSRLRPAFAPRLGRPLLRWLCHDFLNVRTYVRVRGEPGIHFIAEWVPRRIAVLLGPRLYGLPYRFGRLEYDPPRDTLRRAGRVHDASTTASLSFEAHLTAAPPRPCDSGSLDEFLLERYTAFTLHRGVARLFRIEHEPWLQTTARVKIDDAGLLTRCGAWAGNAHMIGANHSRGATDIRIGRPRRLNMTSLGDDFKMPIHQPRTDRGWVFYDGDCPRCTAFALRFQRAWQRHGYDIAPLQTPWVAQRLQVPPDELLSAMRVITPNGHVLAGADAMLHLAGLMVWLRPLAFIAELPPLKPLLHSAYAWLAKHRTCRCHPHGHPRR